MNIKTISAACLFTALNIGAISAHAATQAPTQTYKYGTHLDIQKVVAHSTDSSSSCEAVNNHLTYLDSEGQTRGLEYLTLSNVCNQGG